MRERERVAYIDRGKDILKGHVGQEEEYGSIDVHHAHLRQLLPQKDESNQHSYHLRSGNETFKLFDIEIGL